MIREFSAFLAFFLIFAIVICVITEKLARLLCKLRGEDPDKIAFEDVDGQYVTYLECAEAELWLPVVLVLIALSMALVAFF